METVTSSGLTPFALATTVLLAVAGCTCIVAVLGWLIDRSAATHELNEKDR